MSDHELDEYLKEILTDPRRMNYVGKMIKGAEIPPMRPFTYHTMVHEMTQYPNDYRLEEIKVPALICHGTFDGDVEFEQGQTASEKIPGAELYTLEGAHHLMHLHPKSREMREA